MRIGGIRGDTESSSDYHSTVYCISTSDHPRGALIRDFANEAAVPVPFWQIACPYKQLQYCISPGNRTLLYNGREDP